MDREELLTVAEVALYLKVDRESVRRWLRSSALAGINLGRAGWRVRASDLDHFLSARSDAGEGENSLQHSNRETTTHGED